MSTDLALFKGGLPSFLKGATDSITSALAGSPSGNRRISIKGGVFREIVGGEEYRVSEDRAMNVIIINAAPNIGRTYYSGTYVEGENAAPVCWSADGKTPSETASAPQSNNCLHCPQNIKGSGQGESRACRFSQRIAVLIEGEVEQEQVYQLTLPSTSIFGNEDKNKMPLQAYARWLASNQAPIFGVVTEMRFDTASPTPKLVFKAVRSITESEYEVVQRLMHAPETINAITMTVAQKDSEADKEAFAPAPKSTAPKLAAPMQAVEAEEVEEPKKAPTKKAPPVNESKLEDLVGEWDD